MHLPLLPTIALTLSTLTLTLADRNLYIVAHQDDDLLFLNPSLLHSIRDNHSIQTIYLTAGDAGLGPEYWTSRQTGALAAYAQMAGVSNTWDESGLEIPAGEIRLYTLRERAENPISLAFMHLPDGNGDGSGFAATGNESLEKLWKGAIGTINTVDESGISYTREELISALASVIDRYGPDSVSAQDYVDAFGSGDHSDHTAGALFANEAAVRSSFGGSVAAYEGYPIKDLPANVGGADLDAKKAAFYTYAPYDSAACASDAACGGREYELWLQREYLAN
ncbi:GlcNAc-PI de-N-acetylase-domain-containing protein [Aspergillus lucknowensis]|uniref:N-acetylglucosaminylphosphatidylinositol deacetylase n=1 Tax=Aspergillus lucknowensis TaxID=176173 RepID=A0ABR4M4A2_9EURO